MKSILSFLLFLAYVPVAYILAGVIPGVVVIVVIIAVIVACQRRRSLGSG
jgi:hypothetical protein